MMAHIEVPVLMPVPMVYVTVGDSPCVAVTGMEDVVGEVIGVFVAVVVAVVEGKASVSCGRCGRRTAKLVMVLVVESMVIVRTRCVRARKVS